ncbi:EAL domain-containing protein [Candidatus Sodalis sp. SoCistrobi]|uniref:EAL domain-containing protein n=1 Tax=Candidatus Sodalis sp. SoCistrobi TaxID=1922216 RepID=UPI00093AA02E|nr:EAL domain-containing protein [Candidatus Sodalis sp. SoCistrobi]
MSNYRFILWGVIPLLFFIVSIVLLLFVTQQNSKSQVREEIHGLINVIDTLMSNGDDTAQRALLLAGRPCPAVLETLRDLAGRYPLIRSVSLADQNGLYCSSAPAMKHALTPVPAGAKGAALSLQVGPAAAEIVLEQRRGQTRAVVIMDSHTLRAIITTLSPSRPVGLAIGDTVLTSAGTLIPLGAQDPKKRLISGVSARYPYRLQMATPPGVPWRYFLINAGHMILLIAAIALMMALLIHQWLRAAGSLKNNMLLGLKRNEFEAYYQPVMNVAQGYCSGVEILVRWRHPADGFISPEVFVPLAEASGLILPLTAQLMTQVAEDLAQHWSANDETLHVAFNIAAIHLQSDKIVKDCRQFLQKVHSRNILLVLELTERQYIEFNAATRKILASLQALGVIIAIDDFGTGYSGLSYLGNMQINLLKIDRSFVAMIAQEDSATDLVDVVIELANRFGMEVIAEGVETELQKSYLLNKRVVYQQGFLFAQPLPLMAFLSWYHQQRRSRSAASPALPPRVGSAVKQKNALPPG